MAIANTAWVAGKRCARHSAIPVTGQRLRRVRTADANYVGLLPKDVGFVEIAPVLCAVTVYKGLKVTDTKPGDWVAISGIGGLGHMAVQYARAMGLNVAAVDVDDNKLALARQLGAQITVNARTTDPAAFLRKEIGGAHGALVTAVSPKAFEQALGMVRRGGTVSLNGLPPGNFPLDIFGMVLNGITVRGSIVGTRLDLQESLQFAAEGRSRPRSAPTAWRTSTTCSRACTRAPLRAAWYSTSPPDRLCMAVVAPSPLPRTRRPCRSIGAGRWPANPGSAGRWPATRHSVAAVQCAHARPAQDPVPVHRRPDRRRPVACAGQQRRQLAAPLLGLSPDNNSVQLGWDLTFSVLGGIAGVSFATYYAPAGRVRMASRSGR